MITKLFTLIVVSAALTFTSPAQADRYTNVMTALVFTFVFGGTSAAVIAPEVRSQQMKKTIQSPDFKNAGLSMHLELGAGYEGVIASMARRKPSKNIEWIQKAGPVSKAAYIAYVNLISER